MNPKSRKKDLAIQDLNGELFVYDLVTDQMYSLNTTSAFVWNHLDGEASVEILARKTSEQFDYPVTEDFIWLAIDELRKFNLLDEETAPKAMSKMKRREMVKRVGLATMIALPVISSLIAPTAINAASGGVAICQPCVSPANVTQGNCASGTLCVQQYMGANRICATSSDLGSTSQTGYVAGNLNSSYVQTTMAGCNSFASQFCCKSTATFTGPNTCTCN